MFFKSLFPVLDTCVSVGITLVAAADGKLTATVIPKPKQTDGDNAALATPLALTGTAEELDAEFADLIASYAGSRKSLAEQLEATAAVLEAAKQQSVKKATKATAKASGTGQAKPDSKPSGDFEDDEEGGGEGKGSAEGLPTGDGAPVGGDNLWES